MSFAQAIDLIFGKGVVGIAVNPAFAGLGRGDDGMAAGPRVLTGVLVRRTVAAKRYTALLTGAKMDPTGADLHALFAFMTSRRPDRCNRIEM